MMIVRQRLPEMEWVVRRLMALILLTAGISKFFSGGGFFSYYADLFANEDLYINLPLFPVKRYL